MEIWIVPAANISMGVRKLTNHLTQDISQRVTIRNGRQELGIFVVHFLPINPVHLRFVEVIAFLAPDLIENIFPFLRRIDFSSHAIQAQHAVSDFLCLSSRLRINDSVGMSGARIAAFAFIKQLGAVEGKREALDTFNQCFFFAVFQIVSVYGCAFAR